MSDILHGDCIELMAEMEADSVDAIVCDPPYATGEAEMFTEEEIELLVHCLGLYVAEVDIGTEERQEVKELTEKLEGMKRDDFIGGALLLGIKNKLRECVETLKSKDATLEAICSMLEKEPSPKELDIIKAVLSGAEIVDSTNYPEYVQSHLSPYWKIFKPEVEEA